jgi:hypothetical protein
VTLNSIRSPVPRKSNWIFQILRRNSILQHFIKGKIEGRIKVREDEKEEVNSYQVTLREIEDIVN